MIIRIVFLIASIIFSLNSESVYDEDLSALMNLKEKSSNETNIKNHIRELHKLNNKENKTNRIDNTFRYIKNYFTRNNIKYMENFLKEIGFIGYSQSIIYSKVKGKGNSEINIIIPIETSKNIKNNLAVGIIIELLHKLKNIKPENGLNVYFIEDDSWDENSIISSSILLSNNYIDTNTNTIYLTLNEDKENETITLKNESNIINSKTKLNFLEIIMNSFDNSALDYNINKIYNSTLNKTYNLYLEKEIPFLIISNNINNFLPKYFNFKKNTIKEAYDGISNILNIKQNPNTNNYRHYVIWNFILKKIIITENSLIIIIFIIYNLIILEFIARLKEANLIIQKIKKNYHKIVHLFFILLTSAYASITITNNFLSKYSNMIEYNIIDPIYLVNFFFTLFIFNFLYYYSYHINISLRFRELKYLSIIIFLIEFIAMLYINIELILILILKNALILILPSKNNISSSIILSIIWIVNFSLIIWVQSTNVVVNSFILSFLISISLFSSIFININENLKHKYSKIKQELRKSEKLEYIILFLTISILIFSNSINKISTMKISQIISFPERSNKISIEYLRENKNTLQIITSNFNLILSKNNKTIKDEIEAENDLIDINIKKVNISDRSLYNLEFHTNKIADKIELTLKGTPSLIIYQSNTPYEIKPNSIIFSLKNINSEKIVIAFTSKSENEIEYDAVAYFNNDSEAVKIYDIENKKEVNNINIEYEYKIKYTGILPKVGDEYKIVDYFKLQGDKDIDSLKNIKLN